MPKTTLQALEELTDVIKSLSDKIDLLVKQKDEVEVVGKPKEPNPTISESDFLNNAYPVPVEYLRSLETILNQKFRCQVTPLTDRPAFQFTIIVPDEYSDASPQYKEMYKYDIRPRVVSYAEGVAGVKEWCEVVYKKFNHETQSKISADRATNF